ncbi:MAG: hypothetical protein AAGA05_02805 [Pseudomonadota bacterium]
MRSIFLTLASAAFLTGPIMAFAQTELDTNGDGVLTLDEVQAAFPEITVENFAAMDVNADGALDGDEIVAAQEAGLMPATEG